MDVINTRERVISFSIFFLLFLFSIGLIITIVFSNVNIPIRENVELKKENDILKGEYEYQNKFTADIEIIKNYSDSLNSSKTDEDYYRQLALQKIAEVELTIPKKDTSTYRTLLYGNILLTNRELLESRMSLKKVSIDKSGIDSLHAKVRTYEVEIDKLKRDLDVCRIINRN